jgi:chromosome segregation protein
MGGDLTVYLKKLESFGFKSFGQKIELEFQPGITAIVGPNGSGKSNITDAIQWVLGEQSIKSLRGTKTEDVIFAGSKSKKPLGIAEVSITIDNSDRKMPVDFAEVNITRRIFRSGDSEFYINKTACRLKDIHELLMDTGVGKDGYSIISQGKIDEIINSRPVDRRGLFEEAAGIVKFKNRKREAEKKLEETNNNILRVEDLIIELYEQLEPLMEQAEKARVYKGFKSQLDTLEINNLMFHIEKIYDQKQALEKKLEKLNDALLQGKVQLQLAEAQSEEWISVLSKLDETINKLQQESFELQRNISRLEEKIASSNEVINRIDEETKNLEEEKNILMGNTTKNQQEERDLEVSVNTLETELNTLSLELININNLIAEAARLTLEHEGDMETFKDNLLETVKKASEAKNSFNSLDIMEKNLNSRLRQINREVKERQEAIGKERDNLNLKESELKEGENQSNTLLTELQRLIDEKTQLSVNLSQGEKEIRNLEHTIKGKDDRIKFLEELEDSFEGYSRGVKFLMNWAKANSKGEIYGPVAQLFKSPTGYELAMEVALGGALQNIIVEDSTTAKKSIDLLKANKWGRVTFLPVKSIEGRKYLKEETDQFKNTKGYLGIAVDLIKVDNKLINIFDQLLGRTLVFYDLASGLAFSEKTKNRYRIVTLDGDIFSPGGALTGGFTGKENQGLVLRSVEINSIQREVGELTEEYQRMVKSLNKLQESLKDSNSLIELKEGEIQKLQRDILEIKGSITLHASLISRMDEEAKKLLIEKELIDGELMGLGDQRINLTALMEELKLEEENIQEKIKSMQRLYLESKTKKDGYTEESTKLQVKFAQWEQHLKDERLRLVRQREQGFVIQGQIENIDNKINGNKAKKAEIDVTRANNKADIDNLFEQHHVVNNNLTQTQEERQDYKNRFDTLNMRIKDLNKEINKNQTSYYTSENNYNLLESEMNNMCQNLSEFYSLTYERAKAQHYSREFYPDDYLENRSELKAKLDELGEVNLGAIEEYERISQRHSFLTTQRDDLNKAKESLGQIIDEITENMEKRFIKSIECINICLQDVFTTLFGGGQAEINIMDGENVLESGIEIIAQPPGKKLQSLSLLSGGEKALTAIAILFAILKYKPSPFCVLDEIESSLDDANVDRFANYLLTVAGDRQFIIITHRKGTMTAADTLYGMTMDTEGISKIVSVDFDNRAS